MEWIVYREASSLARDLGVPLGALYAVSRHLSRHYRPVERPKAGGGVRRLWVPHARLKEIQRRILHRLLDYRVPSPWATAYRFGGGPVPNAARHAGRPWLLKLDIQGFFDHILYRDVKEAAFPADTFAEPLRVLLSMLCYYREGLPQGAPTSPAVANLVMAGFDRQVGAWCGARGIVYTRYCDDMAFSASHRMEGLLLFVEAALGERGLFLRRDKTLLAGPGQRKLVTGLVVNEGVDLPAPRRRALRQEVYYCRRFGLEGHAAARGEDPDRCLRRLLGQVGFWLQADPESREAGELRTWLLGELRRRSGR